MNLITQLRAIGEEANHMTADTLNSGGCAVWAALVGARLKALGVRHVVGRVGGYAGGRQWLASAKRKLGPAGTYEGRQWFNAHPQAHMSHVLLQFDYEGGQWIHDSEQTVEAAAYRGFYKLELGFLPYRDLQWIAQDQNADMWNSYFPRDYIPRLAALVKDLHL